MSNGLCRGREVIVLDASIVVELLPQTDIGEELAERMLESGEKFHVPHLVDVEVTHAQGSRSKLNAA